MVVVNPAGDVMLMVTVPEDVPTAKATLMLANVAFNELGTGEPPSTLTVSPVVPATETVLPAATGFRRTGLLSATKNEMRPEKLNSAV